MATKFGKVVFPKVDTLMSAIFTLLEITRQSHLVLEVRESL